MPKSAKNLIIVESPTKAKTISKFVGSGFDVRSSFGHVRDLPKRDLGIDVERNFAPKYVIPLKAKSVVSSLKKAAEKAERVILATDEDREGEAIAWHLAQALGLRQRPTANRRLPTKKKSEVGSRKLAVAVAERITFDEITKKAIFHALENPRSINKLLVDAQQARRILDRLVGYKLSPLLWKKISRGLSAGRVQSVALRYVVERERERQAFKPREYWTIEAILGKPGVGSRELEVGDAKELPEGVFIARLAEIDGKTVGKFGVENEAGAKEIVSALESAAWTVRAVAQKEVLRKPFPPFTTSTLQQTTGQRFGFSTKQTMRFAQQLYELGHITYMRTDSVHLSEESLASALSFIQEQYGSAYADGAPRRYETKSRLAQEAHEAIRPTDPALTPETIKLDLEPRAWRLYDLIWRRFVASQMPPARYLETDVRILAGQCVFAARGLTLQFDGCRRVYPVRTQEVLLPPLTEREVLALLALNTLQHFTEPPPRYTEATLVKTLEENGVGRPSTYAPTMTVIQERGYVAKDERRALTPTEVGFAVSDLLTEHFPLVIDAAFTAKMEEDLDNIASGKLIWQKVIQRFYTPFARTLKEKHETIAKMVEETTETCEKCGKPMVVRMGRFGRFMACSGFPECKNAKSLPGSGAEESDGGGAAGILGEETGERCQTCGAPLVARRGRFGPFESCSRYPDCTYIKKKNYAIGMKCPKCIEGEVVTRRTKKRRIFYGCSRYPACDYATWQRPAEAFSEEGQRPADSSATASTPAEAGSERM